MPPDFPSAPECECPCPLNNSGTRWPFGRHSTSNDEKTSGPDQGSIGQTIRYGTGRRQGPEGSHRGRKGEPRSTRYDFEHEIYYNNEQNDDCVKLVSGTDASNVTCSLKVKLHKEDGVAHV